MVRNVLGSLIALVGATAAVWSPFRPWYDGRHGSDVRIEDLFNGITRSSAALFGSVVLPMAFAALLTLIGVALRSRALVTLAGLVVLGFTILWMVRQGQAASELTAGARGLGVGVANALGGGALLLLGALIMRGRGRRVPDRGYDERRYADGRYGPSAPDDRYDERAPYDPHTPYPRGHPNPGTRAAREPRSGTRSRIPPAPPDPRQAPRHPADPVAVPTARGRTPPPLPCRSPRHHHRPRSTSGHSRNNGLSNLNSRSNRNRHRRPCRPISSPPHLRWSGARNTGSRAPRSHNSPDSKVSPVSLTGPNAPNSRRRTGSRRTAGPRPGRCARRPAAASASPPAHDSRRTHDRRASPVPLAASSAYTQRSLLHAYTTPPTATGEPVISPPVASFQRSWPPIASSV